MKTTLITLILSILTTSLIAQSKEYYRHENTIKTNGTEYLIIQPEATRSFRIIEKENRDRDFSRNRTKDGTGLITLEGMPQKVEVYRLEAFATLCDVVNRDMIHPTIKRVLNKYGFDIYDWDDSGISVVPPDFYRLGNFVSMHIYFNVESKKPENILFTLIDDNGDKANSVPIEAYDGINKELKRILSCIPNKIGEQLLYCNVMYCFTLK